MHIQSLHKWTHSHNFNVDDGHAERNTRRVILLTVFMMVIEISAGYLFGSMALLADGWHMGTHAVALGIAAFAYYYARLNSDNPNYSFGTGKVGVLGGFASAVVLAIVALLMGIESIERLISPKQIHFNEAIAVAVIGLIVNIISALLLQDRHHHSEGHSSDKIHQDHNLKAAYLHVMADALTSLLAIIALFTGKMFGWIWMDPIMGIVGALLITRWSYRLLIDTGKILLDRDINQEAVAEIQAKIESDSDNKVSDIHVWRVGSYHLSAIISIVTDYPKPPEYYKTLLADYEELVHVTVEVIKCDDEACVL
ncbi:MAG: CDF family Co(II)/Ni(II) efflux transporter DmeF [Deltaproteobacteria bacterium]|jgi:cation diffusion facilitator family transporter|nr:CDF family Co(II)/Ni(II) efflux transporter DmeF [Deltaproteobacteria bacterium]MBW2156139.1 CDF family Co(II)/Ni(II) efflux transporter DmeF [Deltaproteobacteria bacterium]